MHSSKIYPCSRVTHNRTFSHVPIQISTVATGARGGAQVFWIIRVPMKTKWMIHDVSWELPSLVLYTFLFLWFYFACFFLFNAVVCLKIHLVHNYPPSIFFVFSSCSYFFSSSKYPSEWNHGNEKRKKNRIFIAVHLDNMYLYSMSVSVGSLLPIMTSSNWIVSSSSHQKGIHNRGFKAHWQRDEASMFQKEKKSCLWLRVMGMLYPLLRRGIIKTNR